MSTPTALHEAIEKAIRDHCAGGDLWLCAHIASEPFDARIAELERERDELRAKLAQAESTITFVCAAIETSLRVGNFDAIMDVPGGRT